MKKNNIIFLTTLGIVLISLYLYRISSRQQNNQSSSPTPRNSSSTSLVYCSPQDLQAELTLSHAAGNIYGTFTIKNVSDKKCQVTGNDFIAAGYDTHRIKNVNVTHLGKPEAELFQLASNQTIYSQVHYPNVLQCGRGIQTAKITFDYAISSTHRVTFTDQHEI